MEQTLTDVALGLVGSERGIRFLQGGERETFVSYGELLARARGLLATFQQRGLKPGDAVLLFVRNNVAFVDAFWACQLGGLIPVPLSAALHAEYLHKLQAVAARLERPFLFTERELMQRFHAFAGGKTPFDSRVCFLEEIDRLQASADIHHAAASDTALIQFSSGSTSEPKGVVLSHANLLNNIRAISKAACIDRDDSTLSWMPLSHDMGLIGFHLVPLCNRINQVIMDTEVFVRRPARWLEMAHAWRASLLCSPNFGYQHYLKAVPQPAEGLDLSGVRLIFNGAEPVSASVCRDFAKRLKPHGLDANAFYPVYGLAEASLAVTFPQPGHGVQSLRLAAARLSVGDCVSVDDAAAQSVEMVCLGFPVDGCEVRICNDDKLPLAEGCIGHVQIRGDNVTRGYYSRESGTNSLLPDGWLDTGDLGFFSPQGLVITGRARDILFVSGQNWYPQDIEQLLQQSVAGIEAGKVAVAATRSDSNAEDLIVIFVQHRRDIAAFAEKVHNIKAVLTESTGLHAHAVVPVHSLPRTTSGKLQRYRLVEAFERGEYRQVLAELDACLDTSAATAAANPCEQQLLDICSQVFPGRHLQTDQNLFELGADSLLLVKIHEEIELCFPGKVEITDLFDYPTIAALAAYIEGS